MFCHLYRLLILDIGPNRLRVLAYLRDLLGISIAEIKARTEELPILVAEQNFDYIRRLMDELTIRGAATRLEISPESSEFSRPKKDLVATVELDLIAGQASPGRTLCGPLKPYGINIGQLICNFNSQTESRRGELVRVSVAIFSDRSFTFVVNDANFSASK